MRSAFGCLATAVSFSFSELSALYFVNGSLSLAASQLKGFSGKFANAGDIDGAFMLQKRFKSGQEGVLVLLSFQIAILGFAELVRVACYLTLHIPASEGCKLLRRVALARTQASHDSPSVILSVLTLAAWARGIQVNKLFFGLSAHLQYPFFVIVRNRLDESAPIGPASGLTSIVFVGVHGEGRNVFDANFGHPFGRVQNHYVVRLCFANGALEHMRPHIQRYIAIKHLVQLFIHVRPLFSIGGTACG
jgi:hypothetical protein